MTATPEEVSRLSRICGMLGSANANERAIAAEKATTELRRLGMTWAELVEAAAAGRAPRPSAFRPVAAEFPWRDAARIIEAAYDNGVVQLTDWELRFLTGIYTRTTPPTDRQEEVLSRLWQKVHATSPAPNAGRANGG